MMMGFDYAPKAGTYKDPSSTINGPGGIPFGLVFQCPTYPPPMVSYRQWGGNWPNASAGGYSCNTTQSYGLRNFSSSCYFPGEVQVAGNTSPDSGRALIKLPSLYKPSDMPYMVDTYGPVNDAATNTAVVGYVQTSLWAMGSGSIGNGWGNGSALHMRHNKRANVWFPDGHAGSWGASDTNVLKYPNAGGFSTNRIGYSY